MNCSATASFALVVVGAGPAGIAPLLAASKEEKLGDLLKAGVIIIDDSDRIGAGTIGSYAIRSDSTALAILDIIMRPHDDAFTALRDNPIVLEVAAYGNDAVPLSLAGEFLHLLGTTVLDLVAASPRGRILRNTHALFVRQISPHEWDTHVFDRDRGIAEVLRSSSVVLATGAHQPEARLFLEAVAGQPLLPRYKGRVLQSGYALTSVGLSDIAARLEDREQARIVIVGGSTSAGAVAHAMLNRLPSSSQFGPESITILHRRPLHIFYSSVAEAEADGYTEFGPLDVCPLSGRVYRLGGFRLDSRELIMSVRGIGGRPPEPRVRLQLISPEKSFQCQKLLDEADVIIAAMGYLPRALPIFDEKNQPIALMLERNGSNRLVDAYCRVLDQHGAAISGLFAIGLAAGHPPDRELGGEATFEGQINSLWLWQHALGNRIVSQVLDRSRTLLVPQSKAPLPTLVTQVQAKPQVRHIQEDLVQVPFLESPRLQIERRSHSRHILPPDAPLPLIRPNPPKLSHNGAALAAIEDSGIYSNYGPVNSRFELALIDKLFIRGSCLTVCNATIGLMLAIREVIEERQSPKRRFALMPSFTFAATAHAAVWNGLIPLLCDIDPETWLPSHQAEELLLKQYKDQIAVIIPYATFGNNLDLARYERIAKEQGIPIVIDAAASLGSLDERGLAFGTDFPWPVVFSMHATKIFSMGEGGVIYCSNAKRIDRLRSMGSFGFESPRVSTLPGLNSKLSEVSALTALLQLDQFDTVLERRKVLTRKYMQKLPGWQRQKLNGIPALSFESVLLPAPLVSFRASIIETLKEKGIGAGTYFSPHIAEHPYFIDRTVSGCLDVTADISSRILTLPMFDNMLERDIVFVCASLWNVLRTLQPNQETILDARDNPRRSLPSAKVG
ncbi:DegT/DnrJ/EryC1/StrS family aminotransferase [Granulicella tundricola]|uniref:DegT/DnrJ/EryC1/StrS aminotransferase n=1 Tax=Granulicella tundricola (strain ATCC BAA-1859 / DSM 23138 / MP5ACTX9) TaxID=1198114 RepID=E8X7T2_GRATM|nr:DegT/DnrJ/EryC1/StrS family aminotransferase [Granulicella tundricola]ADW71516.1 DegT/DnrJ/EryC1/StrS aminotransferase [Granulicella tundricola MP5ACTX9]